MKSRLVKKICLLGIVTLMVETGLTSNIHGYMSDTKNAVLFLKESSLANVTVNDTIGDVCSIDYSTGETSIVTTSPNIAVENLDVLNATYTRYGGQVTLSLSVVGIIEDRGHTLDPGGNFTEINAVEYGFILSTSEEYYMITYCNQTSQLSYDAVVVNLTSTNFSVIGDTLSIWFSLVSVDEIYEKLDARSNYIKLNFSNPSPENFVYFADLAPNPPLNIMSIYGPDMGYQGENIQFNASVEPLTGLPPYTYLWDFGDQGTSTELNPTHVYSKTGVYQYTFTVSDDAGATASDSGYITIQREGTLIKAFLFGRYANNISHGDSITFSAVNLGMIFFLPPAFHHFIAGERITVSKQFFGIKMENFLIGLFSIASVSLPPQTPNIACTTDSTTNRLIIAAADVDIKWRDIVISTDTQGVSWRVYSADGMPIDAWNHTNGAGLAEVIAGDYIQLQFNVTTPPSNVRITFRYIPTSALLGTWTVNV